MLHNIINFYDIIFMMDYFPMFLKLESKYISNYLKSGSF